MGGITGGKGGGGGKKGGGAPSAPDFQAAADTQARTSHNDVNGAFGGANWTQGADGRYTLNASMNPELQGAANGLMGQMQAGAQINPAQARDQAIQAAYGQSTSRLDPQWAQREESTRAQLGAQGIDAGSEAYNREMGNFDRSRNDAYQQAMYGAQTGAGNAAFGQSLAANMQPYQQLGAINGIGQGMASQALGQAQPTQSLAAAMQQYSGDLQKYGIEQQGKNSKMGGAAGLGGAALLGSALAPAAPAAAVLV